MFMTTDDLKKYPLPKALNEKLAYSDTIAQNLARSGRRAPAEIMLYGSDFDVIDRIVRSISGGHQSAHSVQWNGRRLARFSESRASAA